MAKIDLLPIEQDDLETIREWRNTKEVMVYCRQYRPLTQLDAEEWFKRLKEDKEYNLVNDLFMIWKDGDKIGVGGFVRIDWRNRKAELSFYVGEDSFRNEKYITQSIQAIIHYGFATLNLWKIYFPCYSFNPFIPIYKKTMKQEYIAKKEYFWEGKYHDRIVLVAYNRNAKP